MARCGEAQNQALQGFPCLCGSCNVFHPPSRLAMLRGTTDLVSVRLRQCILNGVCAKCNFVGYETLWVMGCEVGLCKTKSTTICDVIFFGFLRFKPVPWTSVIFHPQNNPHYRARYNASDMCLTRKASRTSSTLPATIFSIPLTWTDCGTPDNYRSMVCRSECTTAIQEPFQVGSIVVARSKAGTTRRPAVDLHLLRRIMRSRGPTPRSRTRGNKGGRGGKTRRNEVFVQHAARYSRRRQD